MKTEEKSQEVLLKELVIKIGKKDITLSIEEARKLKTALEDLFGKEVIKEVKHEHHYDWYYKPYWGNDWGTNKFYCTSGIGGTNTNATSGYISQVDATPTVSNSIMYLNIQ